MGYSSNILNLTDEKIFPWDKNFETGNEEIDTQHKNLVKLLNELSYTITHSYEIEIEKSFNKLLDYADYHFRTEEKIWFEHFKDDSWFLEHKKNHDSFVPLINKMKQEYINLPRDYQLDNIVKFLIRWLAFHIIYEDKNMSMIISEISNGKSLEEAKEIVNTRMDGSVKIFIQTILSMYEEMSSKALELLKEKNARKKAEEELLITMNKLKKLTITDSLTKVYNRREFDRIFDSEIKRSQRMDTYFTLILIDIDYFKNINDIHGHDVGDETIIELSNYLKKSCQRSNDFVFRLGGDEFAIITSSNEESNGLELANTIKENISEIKNEILIEKNIKITLSIGLLIKKLSENDNPSKLYKEADKKLYCAKENGRNRVEI